MLLSPPAKKRKNSSLGITTASFSCCPSTAAKCLRIDRISYGEKIADTSTSASFVSSSDWGDGGTEGVGDASGALDAAGTGSDAGGGGAEHGAAGIGAVDGSGAAGAGAGALREALAGGAVGLACLFPMDKDGMVVLK